MTEDFLNYLRYERNRSASKIEIVSSRGSR